MKKILLLFLVCLSLYVYADGSSPQQGDTQYPAGAFVDNRRSKPRPVKRIPPNMDLILLIEDGSVTIRSISDFGTGSYQLQDLSTGYSSNGTIDTSIDNMVEIPFCVSDSSVLDFYIEFEDGSWCHLSWNLN